MRTHLLLLGLVLLLISACSSPIAQLGVQTTDSAGANVTATVNFSNFTQSPATGGNDSNLRLGFSSSSGPDADTMSFVLAPKNPSGSTAAALFPVGSYGIDQVSSTFNAKFLAGSETVEVTADPGSANYINIQSISFASDGTLLSIVADFNMNLKEGGAASGTMSVAF